MNGSGGKIAFACSLGATWQPHIYTMNADGSGRVPLTTVGENLSPAWSPNGAWIAFVRSSSGSRQLIRMNADGSQQVQIAQFPGWCYYPAWSPDGARLAFALTEGFSSPDIYVMSIDGTGLARLTVGGSYSCPRWSPDGSRIAASVSRGGLSIIEIMNPDGSNRRPIASSERGISTIAWSPDGTRIAFSSGGEGDTQIYVMNADGTAPSQLTGSPRDSWHPTWSPDGRQIAFMSDRDSLEERIVHIYAMNADGSSPTRLTNPPGTYLQPEWQPAPYTAPVPPRIHRLVSRGVAMAALGSVGDTPANPAAAALADGIHLRWSFLRELGFPWYGFYLFRRPSQARSPVCLSLLRLRPPWETMPLVTPHGTISSDQPLVLRDRFPPDNEVEFDLRQGGVRFSLPPGELACWVEIDIGFGPGIRSVSFLDVPEGQGAYPVGDGANPLEGEGATFTVFDESGVPSAATRVLGQRGEPRPPGQPEWDTFGGLQVFSRVEIDLPLPSTFVEVRIQHHFEGESLLEAFNEDGSEAGVVTIPTGVDAGGEYMPEAAEVTGSAIRKVVITQPARNETVLEWVRFLPVEDTQSSIQATVFQGSALINRVEITGKVGEVIRTRLEADGLSSVELGAGPACITRVCYASISQDAASGWQLIPGCPYPLSLPVTHPDYPSSGNAPEDAGVAEAEALGRVRYGSPDEWSGEPFADLYAQLTRLVAGGPGSEPMAARTLPPVTGTPDPPGSDASAPTMPGQAPLDTLLLGALHPAVAQMVGLYWVDQNAPPGVAYDYLIVGDYNGRGGRNPNQLLSVLQAEGFDGVEAYIVFNKRRELTPPLAAPADIRCYALPGGTQPARDGSLQDATQNAGLRWNIPAMLPGVLLPLSAVMYHLWRADLGNQETPAAPGVFRLVTGEGPVLVAERVYPAGIPPQRATNWPPFPLHYIDRGLQEGWYAYQVSGIDLFGRHSANSPPGAWYQWAPAPEPRPWYYVDPPEDRVVHASAVRLLDESPPPPPSAIAAFALDPADPTVLRDPAYRAWWESLSAEEQRSLVGLRVRWEWPAALARQAPDVREFRIYYQPGQLNTRSGRITGVTAVSETESEVETDIPDTAGENAYAGTWLRVNSDSFRVVGSSAGSPLRLRVRNLGLTETAGTVSVTRGSAVVTGAGTRWHAAMAGLRLRITGEEEAYTILRVDSPAQLTLGRLYTGETVAEREYAIFDRRPQAGAPCSVVIPASYQFGSVYPVYRSPRLQGVNTDWHAGLAGQTVRVEGDLAPFRIVSVASPTELTLDRRYTGPLRRRSRLYSISHPLYTDFRIPSNWDQRYYVSAFDDNVTETTDAGGRPLRVYEVLLPAPGDTSRAGVPLPTSASEPIAYAQVSVSAADNQPRTADDARWAATPWGNRPGNEGPVGPPASIFRVHREPPPPPAPLPDAERVYATPADYHGHSFYTYRWRPAPGLQVHVFRALDDTVFQVDWAQRPRPPLAAGQVELFPDESADPRWSAARREQVAAELNLLNGFSRDAAGAAEAMAYYRALSNDALRVLAGLPGNDRVFTQLTIRPLDPDDPATFNRTGPDDPPDFPVDPGLRAFRDTLGGRSTNRYFYRAAYVDRAHNRSPLGLSSPPVWLRKVVPPRAPVVTKVLGGDREITLRWASNREPDLAEYHVYRAESEEAARDLRRMTLVYTEEVAATDPIERPADLVWRDRPVTGGVTLYYRLVAIDEAGNVSDPTSPVVARAFDYTPPDAPTWLPATRDAAGAVMLAWDTTVPLRVLVQRQEGSEAWRIVSGWLEPSVTSYQDATAVAGVAYRYRLRVQSASGILNTEFSELEVPA
jgi:WD40 repeat protein